MYSFLSSAKILKFILKDDLSQFFARSLSLAPTQLHAVIHQALGGCDFFKVVWRRELVKGVEKWSTKKPDGRLSWMMFDKLGTTV